MTNQSSSQQIVARIKKSSKYAYQAPDKKWFEVRFTPHDDYNVRGNGNSYRMADVVFGVRLDDGKIVELK